MNLRQSQTLSKKKPSKLVMGFAVLAATAVVGASGVVTAAAQRNPNAPNPTSKAACKNGGWQQYGFKNQGDCVSWWNNRGPGYGGGSNVNVGNSTNVNLNVGGDRNVVYVIINNITNIFN